MQHNLQCLAIGRHCKSKENIVNNKPKAVSTVLEKPSANRLTGEEPR